MVFPVSQIMLSKQIFQLVWLVWQGWLAWLGMYECLDSPPDPSRPAHPPLCLGSPVCVSAPAPTLESMAWGRDQS